MTASRADRRCAAGCADRRCAAGHADRRLKFRRLVAAGLWLLAAPAAAQVPLPLATPFDPETMERADPPLHGMIGKIEIDALKAPNPEAIGVLDAHQGGFPATLWAGTTAPVARALIPLLPGATGSATLRDLERRLLLTAAPPPEGTREGDRPTLVELRAERLMTLGDADGVSRLAKAASGAVAGPALNRMKVDALLLTGDIPGACAETARQVSGGLDGELAKVQVFCALAAGNVLQGNLGLDLLRERKDADHAFIAAAEVMAGLPPVPAGKIKLDIAAPIHVVAFAAAKLPLPEGSVANASAAVARAVSQGPTNPPDLRLAAGERAEAVGVLATEALRKLYLDSSFAPDEMSAPLARAEAAGARGRALLFRAATDQPDPLIKAQFAAKAIELAVAKGQSAGAARVFEVIIGGIRPEPALVAQAPALARALLALGRPEAAAKWLDVGAADPAHIKESERLWPLVAIAASGAGQPLSAAGLAGWRSTLAGLPPEIVARRSAVVLGLLAGLGAKVPDAAWLDTLALPPGGPKPALFAMMQGNALEARLGGTVLAVLAAIGDQPLDKIDTITLSEAASALSVVGLGDDARKLAIEAMLANGV
jgi:hypothetical protein